MNQTPSSPPHFDDGFRARLLDLFSWRRDVRRFRSEPLPSGTLERLIEIGCLAPSVGLSQPWRFVIVEDAKRRQAVLDNFESCNAEALSAYDGDLSIRYARLKLAGLREAPCHLAVFSDRHTGVGHGLGRRTMPEMAEYSTVAAVFSLWLAARAEGIGMGWVSILERPASRRCSICPRIGGSSDISASATRRRRTIVRNWSAVGGSNVNRRPTAFCTVDRRSGLQADRFDSIEKRA